MYRQPKKLILLVYITRKNFFHPKNVNYLRLGAQTTIQRVSQESLSLCQSKIRTRRDPASTLQNRQAPLSLLAKPLDRPPRSVWVPMQNRQALLSLLAKPLHRPLPKIATRPPLPAWLRQNIQENKISPRGEFIFLYILSWPSRGCGATLSGKIRMAGDCSLNCTVN